MWFVYTSSWIVTSAAVMYAISVTGRLSPLWALLIPAFISLSTESKSKDKQKDD